MPSNSCHTLVQVQMVVMQTSRPHCPDIVWVPVLCCCMHTYGCTQEPVTQVRCSGHLHCADPAAWWPQQCLLPAEAVIISSSQEPCSTGADSSTAARATAAIGCAHCTCCRCRCPSCCHCLHSPAAAAMPALALPLLQMILPYSAGCCSLLCRGPHAAMPHLGLTTTSTTNKQGRCTHATQAAAHTSQPAAHLQRWVQSSRPTSAPQCPAA